MMRMTRAAWIGILVACLVAAASLGGCAKQEAPPPEAEAPTAQPAPTPPAEEGAKAPSAEGAGCSVCGRPCEPNRLVQAETATEKFTFCCPFCLARFVREGKIDPAQDKITLHDYLTAEPVSLKEVVIVVESDVVCPGGISAVALGSQASADKFIAQHGGTKTSWEDFLSKKVKSKP